MAKKATASETGLVPRDPNTALEPWEEKLRAKAQVSKESVAGIGGGLAISIKGGTLRVGDNAVPGNAIACVILAHRACKTYYPDVYKPDEVSSPVCFAIGSEDQNFKGLAPHNDAEEKQRDGCDQCEHNVFGTAKVGEGKACRDSYRLAVIQAGDVGQNGVIVPLNERPEALAKLGKAELARLMVPPTSLKEFAKYLRDMADGQMRPLYAVVTKISVSMDASGTYPLVHFQAYNNLTEKQVRMVETRLQSAADEVSQPFPKMGAAPAKGKATKEAPAPVTPPAKARKSKF